MSITSKIFIEHPRLALTPTIQTLDDVEIRVITQGTTSPGATDFPFLVEYDDREQLEQTFDEDETVRSYELVDWTGDRGIYYIEHTSETELISHVVTEVNGFLAHTETKDNGWLVRLLLPDRRALNTVWEYATEHDITFDILELYSNDTRAEATYGLTSEQKAALQTAYDRGYFHEPRDVSLDEVADEMGLSSTAVSGRLRRGMRNLIAATIAEEEPNR